MRDYYIVLKEVSTGHVRSVIRKLTEKDKDSFIKKANASDKYKLLRIHAAD